LLKSFNEWCILNVTDRSSTISPVSIDRWHI
jgi:hypothetical protein